MSGSLNYPLSLCLYPFMKIRSRYDDKTESAKVRIES